MVDLVAKLGTPEFANTNPDRIVSEIIGDIEAILQRKLYPAQVERLLSNVIASREAHLNYAIQFTGEQNFRSLASGKYLDWIGEIFNVYRLEDAPARCTARFTFLPPPNEILLPKGTQVTSSADPGTVIFQTLESRAIYPESSGYSNSKNSDGQPYVEVELEALTNGAIGNGFAPGELNAVIDPIPYLLTAENTEQSKQGLSQESDAQLRQRIALAPEMFSNGSYEGYQFAVFSVSQAIVDCQLIQPEPGRLNVYILSNDGIPSDALITTVAKALSANRRRPITDWVTVLPPAPVEFDVEIHVTTYTGQIASLVRTNVERAVQAYIDQRVPRLGQDIVPSQYVGVAQSVAGVYRVNVVSPSYQKLENSQWAIARSLTVTVVGSEVG